MTRKSIVAQVLDPTTRNIGSVGVAMVSAARKETAK